MIPAHIASWKLKKNKGRDQEDNNVATGDNPRTVRTSLPSTVTNPNIRPPGGWRDQGGSTNPQPAPLGKAPEGYEWGEQRRGGRGEDIRPVLKAKGGGSYQPVDPMAQAKADILLEQEKDRIADENKAADKAAKDAADLVTKTQAGKANTTAYNSARSYGGSQLGARGYNQGLLDKYGVLDMYYGDLEQQKGSMDPMDITPTYNTSNPLANAISTGQSSYRNDVTKQINSAAGQGFETNLIADTMDDTILNTILGKQKGDAQQQIEAAWKRGQLNDGGYAKALEDLATANTTGMGELQKIGGGVLGGYRTGLTGNKNAALSTAGGLTLADLYDINSFKTGLSDLVSKDKGSLETDLYAAIGDQKFFDPAKLISGAGAAQGYYNPSSNASAPATTKQVGTSPLTGLLEDEAKRNVTTPNEVF